MSLAIASQAGYNGSSTTSHAVTLPSGITAGNLLLMFAANATGATINAEPSGWTILASDDANSPRVRVYAKIASGSEGSTVTIGLTASRFLNAVTYQITGARNGVTSSEIAVSSLSTSGSTTANPPSLTPSWGSAENLWFAAAYARTNGYTVTAWPTNYSSGQLTAYGGGGITGVSAAAYLLTASSEDPGTFTFDTSSTYYGLTVAIRPNVTAYTISAGAGSYSITGTAATLRHGWKVAASAGSYSLTGTAAGLKHGWKVAAAAGSYAVTGTAAGLSRGLKTAAGVGSYSVTGTAATLRHGWVVTAGAGSYGITGAAATLTKTGSAAKVLAAGAGSYSVTGTAAGLRRGLRVAAGAGSYALSGAASSLRRGRNLAAGTGSYALTGTAAAIRRERRLGAGAGSYAVTGTAATLTYVPVVGRVSYPSDYPQPLLNGFNAQIAMGVIRAQGPTDQKQRRVFTTMPHMFSLTFIMSVTQWGLWHQWAAANGYKWFLMNLPTFYAGISGGTLSPVLIRFTSGLMANNVSGSDVQVTVTAESAPSMISQYLDAV